MTLKDILKSSNLFTDEQMNDNDVLITANKGISRINTQLSTTFPNYLTVNEKYTALPEAWQLDLMSNYIAYGIKMNDGSLTEADRYLDQFYKSLTLLENKLGSLVDNYIAGKEENGISPDYVDAIGFGGVYGIDTSNAINYGFFGNNGNGGSY